MNKVLAHSDVIDQLSNNMTIGIGGWGARRKPMSLVRAICQSELKDLTVVSYGGPDVGLLCAHKKVKKLIFGFVSLDMIPLEAHFRQARQNNEIEVMELDEGMVQWGLRAAAMNLPFLPTRVGLGTDVLKNSPDIEFVTSPYADKEKLLQCRRSNLMQHFCMLINLTKKEILKLLVQTPSLMNYLLEQQIKLMYLLKKFYRPKI